MAQKVTRWLQVNVCSPLSRILSRNNKPTGDKVFDTRLRSLINLQILSRISGNAKESENLREDWTIFQFKVSELDITNSSIQAFPVVFNIEIERKRKKCRIWRRVMHKPPALAWFWFRLWWNTHLCTKHMAEKGWKRCIFRFYRIHRKETNKTLIHLSSEFAQNRAIPTSTDIHVSDVLFVLFH